MGAVKKTTGPAKNGPMRGAWLHHIPQVSCKKSHQTESKIYLWIFNGKTLYLQAGTQEGTELTLVPLQIDQNLVRQGLILSCPVVSLIKRWSKSVSNFLVCGTEWRVLVVTFHMILWGHEQPNNQGACYRGRVTQFVMQQSPLGIKIDDIIIAVILGKPTCLVTVFAASCHVNIIVWAQTYVIYDWTSVQLVFKLSEVLTAW